MSIEELKIDIAKKILSLSDEEILLKVNDLLLEKIIGYTPDGIPISAEEYIKEMDEQQLDIQERRATFLTTEEVKENIKNESLKA